MKRIIVDVEQIKTKNFHSASVILAAGAEPENMVNETNSTVFAGSIIDTPNGERICLNGAHPGHPVMVADRVSILTVDD